MEPQRPPVTITDPHAPAAGTADVLDQGRDGWRPSRYQAALAALTAAIVALLAGGVQEIRHVHHERALDAAAIADVDLRVVDDGDDELDAPEVALVNRGSHPVHLLGAVLVGDGYREHPLDEELAPDEPTIVRVTSGKNCRVAMYNTQADQVRVRVRTYRGDVVTQTLPLGDAAEAVGFAERDQCGYYRPDEALYVDVVRTRAVHGDVVLTLRLVNSGVEPLTLSEITPVAGLSAAARLPVRLEKRRYWTGFSRSRTLDVRLHVTSCSLLSGALGDDPDLDQGGYDVLQGTVTNGYSTVPVPLPVLAEDGDSFDGSEAASSEPLKQMLARCRTGSVRSAPSDL